MDMCLSIIQKILSIYTLNEVMLQMKGKVKRVSTGLNVHKRLLWKERTVL